MQRTHRKLSAFSLTLNKMHQKIMLEEKLAKRRAAKMESLQKKQSQEQKVRELSKA